MYKAHHTPFSVHIFCEDIHTLQMNDEKHTIEYISMFFFSFCHCLIHHISIEFNQHTAVCTQSSQLHSHTTIPNNLLSALFLKICCCFSLILYFSLFFPLFTSFFFVPLFYEFVLKNVISTEFILNKFIQPNLYSTDLQNLISINFESK